MKTSEHTGDLLVALLKAKAQFQPIVKNQHVTVTTKAGRKYDYDYADLPSIQAATTPALSAEGLIVMSGVVPGPDGTVEVCTRLLHTSDQWIESRIPSGALEDVKALGGFVSYARRYNHLALLDLAGEDDADGSQATGDHLESRTKAVTPPASTTGHVLTPEAPKGTPKNLVQKSDLLHQVQTELTRIGRPSGEVVSLYRAAFGDEVDSWELVCGESLHTLKHGLVYLKTLTPEVSDGATPGSAQVPAAQSTPAPTEARPAVPQRADATEAGPSSASAPAPDADDTVERERIVKEAVDAGIPEKEARHICSHHDLKAAENLLLAAAKKRLQAAAA